MSAIKHSNSLQQSQSSLDCWDLVIACDDGKSPSHDHEGNDSVADDDDKLLLQQHGYGKVSQICHALQGEMLRAEICNTDVLQAAASHDQQQGLLNIVGNFSHKFVAIKRCSKELVHNRLGYEDGFSLIVDHDITKETVLLHHLTSNNTAIGGYICEFVNCFESPSSYYLVYEHVGSCNLLSFTETAHRRLAEQKMSLKQWNKITKFVFWQLAVTLNWLHSDLAVCHLNLTAKNIMIQHVDWESPKICDKLTLKLCDFALAEVFRRDDDNETESMSNSFKCHKLINDQYKSPQVFDSDECEMFDARKADTWELGIILYKLCCGEYPYQVARKTDAGYNAIKQRKLQHYVHDIGLSQYFSQKSFSLVQGLLQYNEKGRFLMAQVIRHEYLGQYLQRYGAQIRSKSKQQRKINRRQTKQLSLLPYYTPNQPKYSM